MFVGFYSLTVSVLCISLFLIRYIGPNIVKEAHEFAIITYLSFGLYTLYILVTLLLIAGIHVDRRYLVLPWLYGIVVMMLYEFFYIVFLSAIHSHKEGVPFSSWNIAFVLLYAVRSVLNVYCFLCVISQYQELTAGRGTYEYLYKQRRQRLPRSSVFQITNDAQLQMHPPPYSSLPRGVSLSRDLPPDLPPPYTLTDVRVPISRNLQNENIYSTIQDLRDQTNPAIGAMVSDNQIVNAHVQVPIPSQQGNAPEAVYCHMQSHFRTEYPTETSAISNPM